MEKSAETQCGQSASGKFKTLARKTKAEPKPRFAPSFRFGGVRCKLIKRRLTPLCKQLRLSPQSFYLALAIFDRLASEFDFEQKELFPLSLGALGLAVKAKESRSTALKAYAVLGILLKSKLKMAAVEKTILQALRFDLNIATAFDFLQLLFTAKQCFEEVPASDSAKFQETAFKLLHFSTFDYSSNQFRPQSKVLGVLMAVRKMFGCKSPFPEPAARGLGHSEQSLGACSRFMEQKLCKYSKKKLKKSDVRVHFKDAQ